MSNKELFIIYHNQNVNNFLNIFIYVYRQRTLHVQKVPQGLPNEGGAGEARADPRAEEGEGGRQEVQVRHVRQGVRQAVRHGAAHARAHRREAERVQHMPQAVPAVVQPEQAPDHPPQPQAVPVRDMQQELRYVTHTHDS